MGTQRTGMFQSLGELVKLVIDELNPGGMTIGGGFQSLGELVKLVIEGCQALYPLLTTVSVAR